MQFFYEQSTILFFLLIISNLTTALHIQGTFNTFDFYKYLTRFGFQSTDIHNVDKTQGYIYGNITIRTPSQRFDNNSNSYLTLIILDRKSFYEFHKKHTIQPRKYACQMMFNNKLTVNLYNLNCNTNGTFDYTRRIPCNTNELCPEHYTNSTQIPLPIANYQFTIKLNYINEAKFFYLSLVACDRDKGTCKWVNEQDDDDTDDYEIDYSIYLVNGNPSAPSIQFEHQLSYEQHDILHIVLISFFIYLTVLPFILARIYKNLHYFYIIILLYIIFELVNRLLLLIHICVYSYNGYGVRLFEYFSLILDSITENLLIFLLILLSKGYSITVLLTRFNLKFLQKNFFYIFIFFSILFILSHIVSIVQFNTLYHTTSYDTFFGFFEIIIRILYMVWFFHELKTTFNFLLQTNKIQKQNANRTVSCGSSSTIGGGMGDVHDLIQSSSSSQPHENGAILQQQLQQQQHVGQQKELSSFGFKISDLKLFYLHFCACSLVWFIYLPILVSILKFVADLYRFRLMLSIRYAVNTISIITLMYLMWSPTSPVILPGKQQMTDTDTTTTQYFFDLLYNEDDDDDEERKEDDADAGYYEDDNNTEIETTFIQQQQQQQHKPTISTVTTNRNKN